jgi:hypothetical protein
MGNNSRFNCDRFLWGLTVISYQLSVISYQLRVMCLSLVKHHTNWWSALVALICPAPYALITVHCSLFTDLSV